MNRIIPYLSLDGIDWAFDGHSRKRVFEQAALIIEKCAGLDHQAVFDAFISREKLGSTCLGGGIGLPHGKVPDEDKIAISVVRLCNAIRLDAPDGKPVRLFFAIAVPANSTEEYRALLEEVKELFNDPQMKRQLITAEDPVSFCQIIESWTPAAQVKTEALEPELVSPVSAAQEPGRIDPE